MRFCVLVEFAIEVAHTPVGTSCIGVIRKLVDELTVEGYRLKAPCTSGLFSDERFGEKGQGWSCQLTSRLLVDHKPKGFLSSLGLTPSIGRHPLLEQATNWPLNHELVPRPVVRQACLPGSPGLDPAR
jgi:hypothetical protein